MIGRHKNKKNQTNEETNGWIQMSLHIEIFTAIFYLYYSVILIWLL